MHLDPTSCKIVLTGSLHLVRLFRTGSILFPGYTTQYGHQIAWLLVLIIYIEFKFEEHYFVFVKINISCVIVENVCHLISMLIIQNVPCTFKHLQTKVVLKKIIATSFSWHLPCSCSLYDIEGKPPCCVLPHASNFSLFCMLSKSHVN